MLKSNTHLRLVLHIEAINIAASINSYTNCSVEKKVNARKQNGDEFSRNQVIPPEVRSWIVVWKVEADVNLSPFSVLKCKRISCIVFIWRLYIFCNSKYKPFKTSFSFFHESVSFMITMYETTYFQPLLHHPSINQITLLFNPVHVLCYVHE